MQFIRIIPSLFAICIIAQTGLAANRDLEKTINSICERSGESAAIGGWRTKCADIDEKVLASGTADEVYKWMSGNLCDTSLNSRAWLFLMHPRLEVKLAAYRVALLQADQLITAAVSDAGKPDPARPGAVTFGYFEKARKQSFAYPDGFEKKIAAKFEKMMKDPDLAMPGWEKGAKKAAIPACVPYGDVFCPEAFLSVVKIMSPRIAPVGAVVSLPDKLQGIVTDPGSVDLLIKIALVVSQRLHDAESGRHEGNLFDDIEAETFRLAARTSAANDLAWEYLGMYSTRGAAMDVLAPFFEKENGPLFAAYYVISAGLSLLDGYRWKAGLTPYSLPPRVTTQCNYGKPYHFWMAAYLARELRKAGKRKSTSLVATHLAGMLYSFSANSWGRDPLAPFLEPFDSIANQGTRIDLAWNDAGAWYGAQGLLRKGPPLSITQGIAEHLAESHAITTNFDGLTYEGIADKLHSDLYRFYLWRQLFAPDAEIGRLKRTQ